MRIVRRNQYTIDQVVVVEPKRKRLIKVWLTDVDEMLKSYVILQFLSNLGVFLYGKDLVLSIGSTSFSSLWFGLTIWLSATIILIVRLILIRRKWTKP